MTVPTVREIDGRLVIDWPDPRPATFEITAEAFELLIDRANGAAVRTIRLEEHPFRLDQTKDDDP